MSLAFQHIFEFLPQARHLGCGGASVVVTGGILGWICVNRYGAVSWTETAVRTSGLCAGGITCCCGHPRDIADFISTNLDIQQMWQAPSPMPRWCWPSHFMVGTVRILPSQSWQSRGSPANADLNPLQIWIDFVMIYQADICIYIYTWTMKESKKKDSDIRSSTSSWMLHPTFCHSWRVALGFFQGRSRFIHQNNWVVMIWSCWRRGWRTQRKNFHQFGRINVAVR